MPAFSIMHQSRAKPVPVTVAMGDLEPVGPGRHSASTFMRCRSSGHVRPYQNTSLRRAEKTGSPMKCAACREEKKGIAE
jgi:hypothetical protein